MLQLLTSSASSRSAASPISSLSAPHGTDAPIRYRCHAGVASAPGDEARLGRGRLSALPTRQPHRGSEAAPALVAALAPTLCIQGGAIPSVRGRRGSHDSLRSRNCAAFSAPPTSPTGPPPLRPRLATRSHPRASRPSVGASSVPGRPLDLGKWRQPYISSSPAQPASPPAHRIAAALRPNAPSHDPPQRTTRAPAPSLAVQPRAHGLPRPLRRIIIHTLPLPCQGHPQATRCLPPHRSQRLGP